MCAVGDNSRIDPFVEIQQGVRIGANCKIQSHAFICTGVEIEAGVFAGHGVLGGVRMGRGALVGAGCRRHSRCEAWGDRSSGTPLEF
jgi:UDP-3-O-[3-hydroxymyristoyl] glucosamine N-acyltransferase